MVPKTKHTKETYLYSITENNNSIYLLGKNQILYGKLLNWNECLNSLQSRELWIDLLSIAIEIFLGKFNALNGIPQNNIERKNLLGNYLKQVISQFVVYHTGKISSGSNFYYSENKEENKEMSQCIDITIEACIEIENFDYLFQDLEPIFETKNYSNLFLSNLEPFILSDKIKNFSLNESIILKIIELYIEKKGLNLLSQLLLHIDIHSLDKPAIKKKLEELELITPLIYLYMNGKEQNYYYPLQKLYELYNKANPIKKFTEYYLLEDISIEEVLASKQYIGHKILWYLKWCLTGRKFPNNEEKMDEKLFKQLIPKIIIWMLEEKNLYEFCKFDPKNYFMILKNIFSIKKLYSILDEFANENEENKITGIILSNKIAKLSDSKPISFVNYIIQMMKNMNDSKILIYLYDFLIKVSLNVDLSKEIIIESINFVFRNYSYFIKDINNSEIKQICNDLKELINKREDLSENEVISMIKNSKDHLFDELILFVYQKYNKYIDCLNIFLNDEFDLEKKANTVFTWLNMILTKCTNEKNKKLFSQLKEIIINKSDSLISLSIEKFKLLVDLWLINSREEILQKITKTKVKYEYIKLILIDIKKELKKTELEEENQAFIEYALTTHIELLCELKLYDKIVPSMKEINIYPYYQIIDILEKYKISDALIFVLLKLGDPDNKAIEICMNDFDKYFTEIKKDFYNEEDDDHHYNKNLKSFEKTIENSYLICINTSTDEIQTVNKNDENSFIKLCYDLWQRFLIKLYSINKDLLNFENKKSKYYIKFKNYFSNKISDLLFTMSNYLSITEIIKMVSEYKDAEFKEFKAILVRMLNSYGSQQNIYTSAKKLIGNCALLNEENLIKSNLKGNEIQIDKCSFCNKKFDKTIESTETIFIFNCGHMIHNKCILREYNDEGEIEICSVCRENEIESSNNTMGFPSKSLLNNSNDDINGRLKSILEHIDMRHLEKRNFNI